MVFALLMRSVISQSTIICICVPISCVHDDLCADVQLLDPTASSFKDNFNYFAHNAINVTLRINSAENTSFELDMKDLSRKKLNISSAGGFVTITFRYDDQDYSGCNFIMNKNIIPIFVPQGLTTIFRFGMLTIYGEMPLFLPNGNYKVDIYYITSIFKTIAQIYQCIIQINFSYLIDHTIENRTNGFYISMNCLSVIKENKLQLKETINPSQIPYVVDIVPIGIETDGDIIIFEDDQMEISYLDELLPN